MIEVPPSPTSSWRKSTACLPNGDCVEVAHTDDHVWIRNSRNPHGPALRFTLDEWAAFLIGIRSGEFDC